MKMRYNSALVIGAFIATSASFVAANDPAREPDVYPSGFAGERRQEVPAPAPDPAAAAGGEGGEPAPAAEGSATATSSVPSGPSGTATSTVAPIGGTSHVVEGGNTTTNGTEVPTNGTTGEQGGALNLGVNAGALLLPLGLAIGAALVGGGILFG